jgi:hypothetical protein
MHLQVEPDREEGGFPARETSTKAFDLFECGAKVVVDGPSIRRVVGQGAAQPPALEFQSAGRRTCVERAKVQAQVDCQLLREHAIQPARGHDWRQLANCQDANVLPVEHQVVVRNDKGGRRKEIRERAEAEGGETLVRGSWRARCIRVADRNQCRSARGLYPSIALSTSLQA